MDNQRCDSLTQMWNDRLTMAVKIEAIVEPFRAKYGLEKQQIQIEHSYHGIAIKVIL